ncbi:hypothetical protein D3C84_1102380 [compost metagenome]
MFGAIHRGIGVLLEGQGDVQSKAVLQPRALMGCGHDAAAGAGDHHQVALGQLGAQLAGQREDGVAFRGSGRTEDRHLAAPLELLQDAEGVLHFA